MRAGLHFTYPRDKQRAQDTRDKLIAAHDVEAHGGSEQQHQVTWSAGVTCNPAEAQQHLFVRPAGILFTGFVGHLIVRCLLPQ